MSEELDRKLERLEKTAEAVRQMDDLYHNYDKVFEGPAYLQDASCHDEDYPPWAKTIQRSYFAYVRGLSENQTRQRVEQALGLLEGRPANEVYTEVVGHHIVPPGRSVVLDDVMYCSIEQVEDALETMASMPPVLRAAQPTMSIVETSGIEEQERILAALKDHGRNQSYGSRSGPDESSGGGGIKDVMTRLLRKYEYERTD